MDKSESALLTKYVHTFNEFASSFVATMANNNKKCLYKSQVFLKLNNLLALWLKKS